MRDAAAQTKPDHVYGKLTVMSGDFSRPGMYGNHRYWRCRCECGSVRIYRAGNLRSGNSTSCGCGQTGRQRKR